MAFVYDMGNLKKYGVGGLEFLGCESFCVVIQ